LAAGGALDVGTLLSAYSQGVFPWFSEGQPMLWWSPDPRMVLKVDSFRLHRSFRKSLQKFVSDVRCVIRFDHAFDQVIKACADKPRRGQPGTWIIGRMVDAYSALHRAGHAHSIETWVDDELVGGLYCVNLGGAIFGESMFAHQTDASKIALAALVAFCRFNNIDMIDCQQNTQHLASLGAGEISRDSFVRNLRGNLGKAAPAWHFKPVYWTELF
jgi:leucyl/phenylalanyl-tRNA---protein transferase